MSSPESLVIVTREEEPGGPLARALESRHIGVVSIPLLRTAPPDDPVPLSKAVAQLDSYDWTVFTSARAVFAVQALSPRVRPRRVAVVGPSTARASENAGWAAQIVGRGGAMDLVETMTTMESLDGHTVFLPISAAAPPRAAEALEKAGALVRAVDAYRTIEVEGAAERMTEALENQPVDGVVFTSPSAVEVFARTIGPFPRRCFAIGSSTAEALRARGFSVGRLPDQPTLSGLAELVSEELLTKR